MVRQKRILIVEDETPVATALERALSTPRGGGYWVEWCESGEAALERLAAARFDLLISDLRLPGISGLELIELSHGADPHMRCVLMTAFGTPQLEAQAQRLADAYVPKPFRLHDLIQTISTVLSEPASLPE
jgi:DNA-binding NtrC family response regulator